MPGIGMSQEANLFFLKLLSDRVGACPYYILLTQLLKHFQRGSRHSFGGEIFPRGLPSVVAHLFAQICISQQERKFLRKVNTIIRLVQ
jgi:hypothetical protein